MNWKLNIPFLKWLYFKKDLDPTKLKVYDDVWILNNNKPVKMMIFAVVESMDYWKQGTEIHYRLVKQRCGTGWGNNEGIRRERKDVFITKQDLFEKLIKI